MGWSSGGGSRGGLPQPAFEEPGNGPFQSRAKRGLGPPAKLLKCARCVQAAARLAIRLGSIPFDFAPVSHQFFHQANQVKDTDLAAGAKIDGFRTIIFLSGENDGFRGIFHIPGYGRGAILPSSFLPRRRPR